MIRPLSWEEMRPLLTLCPWIGEHLGKITSVVGSNAEISKGGERSTATARQKSSQVLDWTRSRRDFSEVRGVSKGIFRKGLLDFSEVASVRGSPQGSLQKNKLLRSSLQTPLKHPRKHSEACASAIDVS